ncbi:MAG: bifunctional methylenetetrahydrofolate dehydrogenase/methenyltetrahydrofolate cyclohydrolase FolD [Bacteroidota bacterium]
MTLIDGNLISNQIKEEVKEKVSQLVQAGHKQPHLAAILVGNDGASQTYVGHKVKSCEQVGFKSTLIRCEDTITENELIQQIHQLNNDPDIDGFIVQLPLPKHIDADKILLEIDASKDVDGFHPINFGRMCLNLPAYIPATPMGIMTLLERYKIETAGKHCVVIGRSNIVGRPMSVLMSRSGIDCTVTLCHSRTKNLTEECLRADIIIAALGKPKFVTKDMVKPGAVIIDVGITRLEDASKKSGYRIVGDVDFEAVKDQCSFITPVPGGVGPMTVVSLLLNTLQASQKLIYSN